jgi:hypothetical protein
MSQLSSHEWVLASEAALEHLKNMLLVLASMNLFQVIYISPCLQLLPYRSQTLYAPGEGEDQGQEQPQSLWSFTWAYVQTFVECNQLLLVLFPQSSPDIPPSLQVCTHVYMFVTRTMCLWSADCSELGRGGTGRYTYKRGRACCCRGSIAGDLATY